MIDTKVCRKCGVVLDSENWYPSAMKNHDHICKECKNKRSREWYKANRETIKEKWQLWAKANPDKLREKHRKSRLQQGYTPMGNNSKCASFLGVHVAERVLSKVFKDVEVMPTNHPGYDIICNRGKRIDVKSSCFNKTGSWNFTIRRNTIADYFFCLAFDNREDLNPLHAWLIQGSKLNHLKGTSICLSTIHKWDAYRIDISKISDCCDTMR